MPYTKTNWKKGMIISSAGLNNMEDQIETLTNSMATIESTADNALTTAESAQTAAAAAQEAVSPETLSTTIINTIETTIEDSSPAEIIPVYNGGDPGLVPTAPPNEGEESTDSKYFLNSRGQWAIVETDVTIDWSQVTVGSGINVDTIPSGTIIDQEAEHFPLVGLMSTDINPDQESGNNIAGAVRKDDDIYITKSSSETILHAPKFAGNSFAGDGSALTNINASNITAGKLTLERLPDDLLTNIPIATTSSVGGIIIGEGLTIDATGTVNVSASASLPTPTGENQFLVTEATEVEGVTTYNWTVKTIPYASSIEGGF